MFPFPSFCDESSNKHNWWSSCGVGCEVLRHLSKSRSAESNGWFIFSFLRILHIDFERDCTNLHSHQQRMRVHLSLQSHQNLLSVILLIFVFLIGVKWNLKVVLILIVFPQWLKMVKSFLDIFISSGENSLFRYLTHFFKTMIHFFWTCFCLLFVYSG